MLSKLGSSRKCIFIAGLIALILGLSSTLPAQNEDAAALKAKARLLIDAQKMTEALPIYEKLAQMTPNDKEVHLYLGFSLLGQAANTTEGPERMQLRVRARKAFLRASELGDNTELVKGLIEGIPADGSDNGYFSNNAAVNRIMQKGEAAFSSGKLEDALTQYQSALKLDPFCYHAALFSGDVYKEMGKPDEAEKWYQRAISIDPNIETAYRYSATPFMKQGKYDIARDRYVEAFIVNPYDRMAVGGIITWGQITKTQLGHPKLNLPKIEIGADGKSKTTINVDPSADDGSIAWSSYISTRETWRISKFALQYPREPAYRHTLAEEVEALRSVVSAAKALKPKKLNDNIALISTMDGDGVLEAFVLMAIPDNGIARDHGAYLRAHRDKLRQYVLNYVISSGK